MTEQYPDPLEFMQSIMKNENLPDELRLEAAKALMPYYHAPVSTIEEHEEE